MWKIKRISELNAIEKENQKLRDENSDNEVKLAAIRKSELDLISKMSKSELELKAVKKENNLLRRVISNPPKYTNGDKVGKYLITEVNLIHKSSLSVLSIENTKLYANLLCVLYFRKPIFSKAEVQAQIKKNNDEIYDYTVFDEETKSLVNIVDSKLDAYKNSLKLNIN